jgi:O-6-methylguanine DNA methyltransferase
MKIYLQNYLADLPGLKQGLVFYKVTCSYGEFTVYCLLGPEKSLLQLTFAPEKHSRLQNMLQQINPDIQFRQLPQKYFSSNNMLCEYFEGIRTTFPANLQSPLLEKGTAFQQRIWEQMRTIPYGSTVTYQQLAAQAGSPKGFRAAGQACGANPLALIIPCHRVVATNSLGGFAGGLQVKKNLLALERRKHERLGSRSKEGIPKTNHRKR